MSLCYSTEIGSEFFRVGLIMLMKSNSHGYEDDQIEGERLRL
jgi:hypothetical protein